MDTITPSKENTFYNSVWLDHDWAEMIENSPAPKHRRRIIKNIVTDSSFKINSVLDVGCGSGILIKELKTLLPGEVQFFGCDISSSVINFNTQKYSGVKWFVSDLDENNLDVTADVVVCSEVLEHVRDWETSLDKLINATRKRLVITVPSGKLFEIDRKVGHYRHFTRAMVDQALKKYPNVKYKLFFWGMPFHTLYKHAINIFPGKIYSSFAQSKYSSRQEIFSKFLYKLFFLNFKTGFEANQMFIIIDKA